MAISRMTTDEARWQTFSVVGGEIARDQTGQIEVLLKLAGDVTLVLLTGNEGVHQIWLPSEPDSTPPERPKPVEPQLPAQNAKRALQAA